MACSLRICDCMGLFVVWGLVLVCFGFIRFLIVVICVWIWF